MQDSNFVNALALDQFNVTQLYMQENAAGDSGGGMYLLVGGNTIEIHMDNSNFFNNTASFRGGGMMKPLSCNDASSCLVFCY